MAQAMVQPHTIPGIVIVGGNQRLALAWAKRARRVPVLYESEHLPAMQAKLTGHVVLATHPA